MESKRWDPIVKLTHWGIVAAVMGNALVTEEGSGWHIWIGYGLAALLALRLLWGLVGPREARFGSFPPSLARARQHVAEIRDGEVTHHASHNPLGALMVYAIWATLLVVVGTGVAMSGPPPANPSAERGEHGEGDKRGEGGRGESEQEEQEEAGERADKLAVLPPAAPAPATGETVQPRRESAEREEAEEEDEQGEAAERRERREESAEAPRAAASGGADAALAAAAVPTGPAPALRAEVSEQEEGEEGEEGEEEGPLGELHELAVNLLYVLIALHLMGVVFETRRSGPQIVRAMLPGGNRD